MDTPDETDTPEDEPAADEESAAEPDKRGRPLSDAFTGVGRRHTTALNAFAPSLRMRNQLVPPIKPLHLKIGLSPELLGIRSMTQRMNSMFQVAIPQNLFIRPAVFDFTPKLNEVMRQLMPSLESIKSFIQNLFPPNWGDARPRDWDEFEHMLAHEGIPVLWVPGPAIVAAIFEAESPAERRKVIGRRWKGIVADCEAVLGSITRTHLADERGFALDCVRALRDGHTNAAQALAATLLDSVLQKFFSEGLRVKLTSNKFKKNGVTFDFDDYHFRMALTFAPVWCAHAKYRPKDGDPIPSDFARHASIHGVSRRQYTRINAVFALMLVTSVIKFLDDELKRRDARS